MTELESFLHYRIVDVSSIKELARRWYPRAYFSAPAKPGNHRALADIQESIEELRYYRAAVFVPRSGPGLRDREGAGRGARRLAHRRRPGPTHRLRRVHCRCFGFSGLVRAVPTRREAVTWWA